MPPCCQSCLSRLKHTTSHLSHPRLFKIEQHIKADGLLVSQVPIVLPSHQWHVQPDLRPLIRRVVLRGSSVLERSIRTVVRLVCPCPDVDLIMTRVDVLRYFVQDPTVSPRWKTSLSVPTKHGICTSSRTTNTSAASLDNTASCLLVGTLVSVCLMIKLLPARW